MEWKNKGLDDGFAGMMTMMMMMIMMVFKDDNYADDLLM